MKASTAEEYAVKIAERFGADPNATLSALLKANETKLKDFAAMIRPLSTNNVDGVSDLALNNIAVVFRKKMNGESTSNPRHANGTLPTPPVVGQVGIHLARYSKLQEQEHELEIKLAEVRREIERYRPIKGLVESLGRAVSQLTEPEKG